MPRKLSLLWMLVLLPCSAFAASVPSVECSGCRTLTDFGNYGAAVLYQAVGVGGPSTGSDRVWVVNPSTSKRAFVDIDTPLRITLFYGFSIPVPDLTKQEINATWGDGSGSASYELPVEVIDAIGDCIDIELDIHRDDSPAEEEDIPEQEFRALPGFNGGPWQYRYLNVNPYTLINGSWEFSVNRASSSPAPLVNVVECAWHDGC